ncbi:hypothetical protein PPYR_12539 [Photinus pyralis]|uniref:Protein sleepless n=1 Tax=Photinus pyralis TaxID=7054 RepID=A0A5N4A6M8_PHOPY|nr:hypothetical protein PPYR_12539 [Photinus pyralis]
MVRYVSFFVCLMLTVDLGLSLVCYTCTSTNVHSCLVAANRQTVRCGRAAPGYTTLCSYIETYDPYRRMYDVQAGCQIVSGVDTMTTIQHKLCSKPNLTVNKCRLCATDYCNGVH